MGWADVSLLPSSGRGRRRRAAARRFNRAEIRRVNDFRTRISVRKIVALNRYKIRQCQSSIALIRGQCWCYCVSVSESENGRLSTILNTMLTWLAGAVVLWLLHPTARTHGSPLGLSRLRATHIRKSIQFLFAIVI